MGAKFTESVVKDAALDWLADLGYIIKYGPDIALRKPAAGHSEDAAP